MPLPGCAHQADIACISVDHRVKNTKRKRRLFIPIKSGTKPRVSPSAGCEPMLYANSRRVSERTHTPRGTTDGELHETAFKDLLHLVDAKQLS